MRHQYSFLILLFLLISRPSVAQEEFPFLGEVTGEGVNIRAGQSTSFEKIGQLKTGEQVVVLGKDYGWYKIKLPIDVKAYINYKFIKELDEKTGEVTGDRVNIRSGIGSDFPIIGQAAQGQYVRILEKSEDWYRIEPTDETFGWITEGLVKFNSKYLPLPRVVEAPIRNIYAKKKAAEAEKSAEGEKSAPTEPSALEAVSAAAPTSAIFLEPIIIRKEDKPVAAKTIVPTVFTAGVVEDLAERSIAKDIYCMISGDNGTTYYLKAPPEVMDLFLHRQVTVEGVPQSDITAPHPVVLITKINLVL